MRCCVQMGAPIDSLCLFPNQPHICDHKGAYASRDICHSFTRKPCMQLKSSAFLPCLIPPVRQDTMQMTEDNAFTRQTNTLNTFKARHLNQPQFDTLCFVQNERHQLGQYITIHNDMTYMYNTTTTLLTFRRPFLLYFMPKR